MKYTAITATVEALQVGAAEPEVMQAFIGNAGDVRPYNEYDEAVLLDKGELGFIVAKPGQFIVKHSNGEFEVLSGGEFGARYTNEAAVGPNAAALEKQLADAQAKLATAETKVVGLEKQLAALKAVAATDKK
ncbi:MAG: hypothetical protein ACRCSS_16510 [Shewanella sp.]